MSIQTDSGITNCVQPFVWYYSPRINGWDFVCEKSNVEQMKKNRAKSVILQHKIRTNNVSGKKSSLSQHTVGLFPWAHCKPTNADTGGLPMRPEHIWRSVTERGKKTKWQKKKNIRYGVFLQVTMQLWCGIQSQHMSIDPGSLMIYGFLALLHDIHKE